MSQELRLEITIDPELPPLVEGAILFETGGTGPFAYGVGRVGPLLAFFEDLISGAPLPLTFAAKSIAGPHTALAATLFFDRSLAVHPATPGFVYLVDLAHRLGDSMLAHTDPSLASFLRGVTPFFQGLSKKEQADRLAQTMSWMRAYLVEGTLPSLGSVAPNPRILDVGTNGFVLASCDPPTKNAWENLFRWGHLKGLLIGYPEGEFRHVMAACKSSQVGFYLDRAIVILDELESLFGSRPGWQLDGNYLISPPDGTTILVQHMVEVFLRC